MIKLGVLEVLTLIFVTLKLTEVIDWSWWVVLSPMYIYVLFLIAVFISAVLNAISEELGRRK